MEVKAGLSQKQIKRNSGYLKEEYRERFMAPHMQMVSGQLTFIVWAFKCP
jgi:hypothetical protein